MISLKPGVRVGGIKPEILLALILVEQAYREFGLDCVVTSCNDGTHMVRSKHYEGLALDFRTKHVPRDKLDALLDRVSALLAPEFEWLLEARGKPHEHLHLEYDRHE